MRKMLMVAALAVVSMFALVGCEEEKATEPTEVVEVVPAPTFVEIGYNKDPEKNRSFVVYTDTDDREAMIEYGKTKMWTFPKLTYVTFVNSEDVQSNTLYQDWDRGILLDGIIPKEKIIGTYKVSPNGNEWWLSEGPLGAGEMLNTKRDM